MSNDTMPCGCEGHLDNIELCRYPALERECDAERAKANERGTRLTLNEERALRAEVERLTRERDEAIQERDSAQDQCAGEQRAANEWSLRLAQVERDRDEARQQRDVAFSEGVGDSAKRMQDIQAELDEWKARAEKAEADLRKTREVLGETELARRMTEADNAAMRGELIAALTKMLNALTAFGSPAQQPFDDAVAALLERLRAAEKVLGFVTIEEDGVTIEHEGIYEAKAAYDATKEGK